MASETCYPIREVARQTGVNPVTLRAWQRRYGLLQPARTDSGHRLYSEADIALIKKILVWLEQGVSISQVKSLLQQPESQPRGSSWERARLALLQAAQSLRAPKLESELRELSSLYPTELLLRQVIEPWLMDMAQQSRPDRELIQGWASALLEQFIYRVLNHSSGPCLALSAAGELSSTAVALSRYELQAQSCHSLFLGHIAPQQLALASQRLSSPIWIVLLGAGLSERWFADNERHWPAHTVFCGDFGRIYQQRGCLQHPYAATISELCRQQHALLDLAAR